MSTDKSLVVSAFLAIVLFIVLFTVVSLVNRSEIYTQTTSSAVAPALEVENSPNDIDYNDEFENYNDFYNTLNEGDGGGE